jgi:DNA polymerase-3 subunit delta
MITFEEIKRELEQGIYRPVYLLMGAEPYFIDVIADYIEEHCLSEADKAFNQTIFYGKDTNAVDIVHEAMQYPLGERRLVMVREIQSLEGESHKSFADKLAPFAKYLENPMPSTVLVLCYKYGTIDKRISIMKAFDKVGAVMESQPIKDYQVESWIKSYVASQGYKIEDKAVVLMTEYIGVNMSMLVSAIEKLQTACGTTTKVITADMVVGNVGVSKDYNVWELRDAIAFRNVAKVNFILNVYARNEKEHPIQQVVAYLFGVFQKLFTYHYIYSKSSVDEISKVLGEKPYSITKFYQPAARNYSARKCFEVIGLLREYDMRSKGYAFPATSSGDLLKELIFRIMN